MISFPWDNTSATVLDRNSTSDILAESYFDSLAGYNSGIFAPVGTQGSVAPGTGMNVVVQPVAGVIKGRVFQETAVRTLTIQASESLDRIDTVVIRRNKAGRAVDEYVVKGTAATLPVRPNLTRSGDVYECGIADIFVPKLATGIMAYHITDTRSETARCQIVPVVGSVDTTSFYDQYQASLDAFLVLVQNALDETEAGYLQGQIGTIANLNTTDKSNLVNATNEINNKTGTLASLNTTDKSNLVNAVVEVNGKIGPLASLTTTVKTSIVNAINSLVALLLPTTVDVMWIGPKQAINIYGQTYKYFWVPYQNAHLYKASDLVTQIPGLGGYTGTSITGCYNNGVQVLDTSALGDGAQIQINFKLTKI